ncbi:MAG: isoprenylcysteine carboxylmethyltransferase family protein [Kiritimatiellae bacterium]|nr:isoprenylcysteine carboxylmethyltransferase family protein [Kiritimatiellia bacterium]MDW8457655.1 isoprenylcysteine carboxylmethyltransferase family protein [Verrucomicrobiota bacterium]
MRGNRSEISPQSVSRTAPLSACFVVVAQGVLAAAIFATCHWPPGPLAWVFAVCGALLGGWALAEMRQSVIRVLPDVHPNARLITSGPYRWIRHPMYAALLLLCAGAWLTDPSWLRLAMIISLGFVLLAKIRIEERSLEARFPAYRDYARCTKRMIPGIW